MGIFNSITDLFFPPKCIFCSRPLEHTERAGRVCRSCRAETAYNEELIPPSDDLSRVCAPLIYTGGVRAALHKFKFNGRSDYAKPLGKFVADEISRRFGGQFDLITWVPVSSGRKKSRGYDQSMLLAASAALELDTVPVSTLEKISETPPNSSLDASGRARNVRGVYRVSAPELVAGKCVLLIDDIYTTGATMRECASMLTEAGAAAVLGAVVARTVRPK